MLIAAALLVAQTQDLPPAIPAEPALPAAIQPPATDQVDPSDRATPLASHGGGQRIISKNEAYNRARTAEGRLGIRLGNDMSYRITGNWPVFEPNTFSDVARIGSDPEYPPVASARFGYGVPMQPAASR